MVADHPLFCFFLRLTARSPFHSRWLPGRHQGDLGPPLGEVIGHCKAHRHKLQPTELPYQFSHGGYEAADLPR